MLLDELRRTRPDVIAVQSGDVIPWVTGSREDSAAALAGFAELGQLIEESYRPVGTFGHLELFARGGAGAASARLPDSNILLITVDTLRPDYLGINGYDLPTSPFIDGLMRRGARFDRAHAPIGRTTQAPEDLGLDDELVLSVETLPGIHDVVLERVETTIDE